MSTPVRQPEQAAAGASSARVRTDIQGLRALAVSLVLIFHLWPNRLSGGFAGVDVFFVISGFLITSHLLAHPPTGGRGLATFWARRIQRLLPASLLVLAVTAVGTRIFAPETQWENTAREIGASALYVVNWRLAATSVDYLAAENAASPVQHFWSLSVEEQFYFFWPILIMLLVLLATLTARRAVGVVGLGLGAVVGASLWYSVHATATEPASAYFVTPTRVWELGVGGLLAVGLSRRAFGRLSESEAIPLPATARTLLAWAGFAAILFTAWTYTGSTPFPGWQALLPVLGTAAVIAAHPPMRNGSPGPFLALRPVQWLGDISYSVYLWHWPLVVLIPYATGHTLGGTEKISIIVASLLLGTLTKIYVEDRFRTASWGRPLWKPFVVAAAGMAVVVALSGVLVQQFQHRQDEAQAALASALAGDDPCFGALALAAPEGQCEPTESGTVVPAPAEAVNDKSDAYDGSCWEYAPFDGMRNCVFGDPKGDVSIALVGNSHAGQWLPAIQQIAERRGWKVTTFLASECTATKTEVEWDADEKVSGCTGWADRVQQSTSNGKYDLVVTSERNGRPALGETLESSPPAWQQGYSDYLKGWAENDVDVLVIHDTPFPASTKGNVPDCIAENPDDLTVCGGQRDDWVPDDPLFAAAKALDDPHVTTTDLTDYLCTDTTCPAAVGGVVAYFDGSHVSATYNKTLAPYLLGPLNQAVRNATR